MLTLKWSFLHNIVCDWRVPQINSKRDFFVADIDIVCGR